MMKPNQRLRENVFIPLFFPTIFFCLPLSLSAFLNRPMIEESSTTVAFIFFPSNTSSGTYQIENRKQKAIVILNFITEYWTDVLVLFWINCEAYICLFMVMVNKKCLIKRRDLSVEIWHNEQHYSVMAVAMHNNAIVKLTGKIDFN